MNRNLIVLWIALTGVINSFGQELDSSLVYANTHGIKNGGVTFFESEGYDVFQEFVSAHLDKKGFKKIKRKYSIPKELEPTTSDEFPGAQIFQTNEEINGKIVGRRTYYCFESGPLLVQVIGSTAKTDPDQSIENLLVGSVKQKLFPQEVYSLLSVDSIKFADRYILLGPACRWMRTHNVQCPNMGQMNWSEFSSKERAEKMVLNQQIVTNEKHLTSTIDSDSVNVIFEGQKTVATRSKVKIKLPKLIMGGSNVLIVYYVVCEVRGRYVACVLSHYTDDINADELPPLLSEVMELDE